MYCYLACRHRCWPWLPNCASFLPYKVVIFPAFHSVLFGERSQGAAHTEEVGSVLHLPTWGHSVFKNYSEFCMRDLFLVLHLISFKPFLSGHTCGYLLYTLDDNPILVFFCCSNCSGFGRSELFQWSPTFLGHNRILEGFVFALLCYGTYLLKSIMCISSSHFSVAPWLHL